jgi:DNA-directed RNA polymerase specialized sigma24 family protein
VNATLDAPRATVRTRIPTFNRDLWDRAAAYVARKNGRLAYWVRRTLGDLKHSDADDLMQHARFVLFVYVVRRGGVPDDFFPRQTIRGECLAWIRKRNQLGFGGTTPVPRGSVWQAGSGDDDGLVEIAAPVPEDDGNEARAEAVRRAIATLPAAERRVVGHLFWDNRTYDQIDGMYRQPAGWAEAVTVRAFDRLRAELQPLAA